MSYTLNNINLATLDTLLQSEGVDPFATGVNSFLIAQGDTKGVTDIKSLISVMTGTPPFPTSQPAKLIILRPPAPTRLIPISFLRCRRLSSMIPGASSILR